MAKITKEQDRLRRDVADKLREQAARLATAIEDEADTIEGWPNEPE